jgi:hypothetical protein
MADAPIIVFTQGGAIFGSDNTRSEPVSRVEERIFVSVWVVYGSTWFGTQPTMLFHPNRWYKCNIEVRRYLPSCYIASDPPSLASMAAIEYCRKSTFHAWSAAADKLGSPL